MSAPAILGRESSQKTQVFTIEEFESRLVSMREMYQDYRHNLGTYFSFSYADLAIQHKVRVTPPPLSYESICHSSSYL